MKQQTREIKNGLLLGAGIGIIFVLVNGIGKAIEVDLSIDNTSGYLQKMFFTTDGGAPTASNVKVMVDGESGNVSLSGELIINPGAFTDGSIMSNDIKDLSVKTEHIIDGAIGTQQLGDNAVTTEKIKDKSVEGIDIGLAQVTNTKNIKDQTYRMVGIKEGTIECDIDGHCTMKYMNGEDINFNKIDTQSLKIGDNAPVGVTLGVENNILATKVCKGTYCVGDKPVEIGELVDNGWCKYDGSKINCTETFGVTETYSWQTSAWTACSKTCGGGTQTRTVVCKDSVGTTVADSKCTTTKPATSQPCNTQACYCSNISLSCDSTLATSCKRIFDNKTNLGQGSISGIYWIDIDGSGPNIPFKVYCDMTSDGGGWTLVIRGKGQSHVSEYVGNSGNMITYNQTNPLGATFKFSDTTINTLATERYRIIGDGHKTCKKFYSGNCNYSSVNKLSGACGVSYDDVGLTIGKKQTGRYERSGLSDRSRQNESIAPSTYPALSFGWYMENGCPSNPGYERKCNGNYANCNFSLRTR